MSLRSFAVTLLVLSCLVATTMAVVNPLKGKWACVPITGSSPYCDLNSKNSTNTTTKVCASASIFGAALAIRSGQNVNNATLSVSGFTKGGYTNYTKQVCPQGDNSKSDYCPSKCKKDSDCGFDDCLNLIPCYSKCLECQSDKWCTKNSAPKAAMPLFASKKDSFCCYTTTATTVVIWPIFAGVSGGCLIGGFVAGIIAAIVYTLTQGKKEDYTPIQD